MNNNDIASSINNLFDVSVFNFFTRTKTGIITLVILLTVFFIWIYVNVKIISRLSEIRSQLISVRRGVQASIDPESVLKEAKEDDELKILTEKKNRKLTIIALSAIALLLFSFILLALYRF